jgi:hypothetical protein
MSSINLSLGGDIHVGWSYLGVHERVYGGTCLVAVGLVTVTFGMSVMEVGLVLVTESMVWLGCALIRF